jgi:hypothetical protein
MIGIMLWFLGIGISAMAILTFFEPRYQLRLMKLFGLKPVDKRSVFVQRMAIFKLAIGIAFMALGMALS